MTTILVASIAAAASILAAVVSASDRGARRSLRDRVAACERAFQRCDRDRVDLRRRMEIVTAAIIATLPVDSRMSLLAELDDRTPAGPRTLDDELDDLEASG